MTSSRPLLQLYPERRELDPWQAYGDLQLKSLAPASRPYVVANMVSTVDGNATRDGRAGGVSSDLDRKLFHVLRTQVDAVMVGTGTIRTENYGPLVPDAERRKRREQLGLAPQPIAVTATRSMDLPVDAPLVADTSSKLVALTNLDRPPPAGGANVDIVLTPGDRIDFGAGLKELRERFGITTILQEGGPTLLGAMIDAELIDELFLTLSPFVGAREDGRRIIEGSSRSKPASLELRSAMTAEQSLFLRYRIFYG